MQIDSVNMNDKIKLLVQENRSGLLISRSHFDSLSDLILNTVNEHDAIFLNQLIALPPIELPGFSGDYAWYLVQVKRHLEVTGVIKTEMQTTCMPVIKKVKKLKRRSMVVPASNAT